MSCYSIQGWRKFISTTMLLRLKERQSSSRGRKRATNRTENSKAQQQTAAKNEKQSPVKRKSCCTVTHVRKLN